MSFPQPEFVIFGTHDVVLKHKHGVARLRESQNKNRGVLFAQFCLFIVRLDNVLLSKKKNYKMNLRLSRLVTFRSKALDTYHLTG